MVIHEADKQLNKEKNPKIKSHWQLSHTPQVGFEPFGIGADRRSHVIEQIAKKINSNDA